MHDPRRSRPPSGRDIAALTFIGEGYEVAQYQLHAAIFPNVSAVAVSHFVTRAVRNGWIAVERWNGGGINRLRLTAAGRDVVQRAGGDASSLFVPKRPVATKDVAHTLWINDMRVALQRAVPPFDAVLPAWQLQRRMIPAPAAVPDTLAVRKARETIPAHVFAGEIDLGGERLVSTFMPKLRVLQKLVREWSGDADFSILVLTSSARRAEAINAFAVSEEIILAAVPLPSLSGVDGMWRVDTIVRTILTRGVNSN
ncbi:MAG TPA: replication-relaxation family protein [Thermoanaerobaculia bacterium]|jgi:hypothetical protein